MADPSLAVVSERISERPSVVWFSPPSSPRSKVIWEPRRVARLLVLGITLATGAAAHAGPADTHLRSTLASAAPDTLVSVIVTVRPDAKPAVLARLHRFGVAPTRDFSVIHAFAATLPAHVIDALIKDPDVVSIASDAPVVSSATLDTASLNLIGSDTSSLTNPVATSPDQAPSGTTSGGGLSSTSSSGDGGTDPLASPGRVDGSQSPSLLRATLGLSASQVGGGTVTVAVIDSGIAPVGDFKNRIAAFYDFTMGGKAVKASDAYGHGTHVAGLVGGTGAASSGLYPGVAPAVKFVGLKVLDQTGAGTTANVISAIQFAVAQRAKFNIRVINLSLGHPIFEPAATDPLVQAVEAAVRAGIVVVTAAGNYGINPATGLAGYAGVTSPGNAPSAITVGAQQLNGTPMVADDVVPIYSSRGPTWYDGYVKPDVIAPGHRQVAPTAPNSTLQLLFASRYPQFLLSNGQYLVLSGTSMATGVASGLAAQVVFAQPALTPAAVKAILQHTATRVKDQSSQFYDALTQGTGAANGAGALALAAAIDPTMPTGAFWLRYGVLPYTAIAGENRAWSENIVWGSRALTGSTVDRQQAAWANNVVWGSNLPWDNVVWGTNIVWGSNIVWGTNIVWGSGLVGQSTDGDNVVWGTGTSDDNVVWGTMSEDNVVWGTLSSVLGMSADNVVWGTTSSGTPTDSTTNGRR